MKKILGFLIMICALHAFGAGEQQAIKNIQFAERDGKTRVTFLLNHPFHLDLEESGRDQITIKAPKDASWVVGNDEKVTGLVKKYQIEELSCVLEVVPNTEISDYGLEKSEFFVDLHNKNPDSPMAEKPSVISVEDPQAFKIEGDVELLQEEELKEDLKRLQMSLNLPDQMAYVDQKDLKKGNLKEEKPRVLKKFKISPTNDIATIANQSRPQPMPLSSAGTMFSKLQSTQEPQASNEGTAPAWVIEAKMHEQRD